MFPKRVQRVEDPVSDLECTLTILPGSDGGAAAVVVDLRNISDDRDVVIKVNREMSAFIMLTVTDQQGVVLSRPAKLFASSEVQHIESLRIARSSSHRWRVPLANQVSAEEVPEPGISGRLVTNVALLFGKVTGDEQLDDADFRQSLLTLYDMDVRYTPAAIREGTEKAATGP